MAWLGGGGLVFEVGEEGGGDRVALQGWAAGEAFVEDAAERVEVGAPVERLALNLLGGDVVGRAREVAGLDAAGDSEPSGEAEIGEVDVLAAGPESRPARCWA